MCDCLRSRRVGAGRVGGLAGTDRHNRTFQIRVISWEAGGEGAREGLAAMATGLGAQARTGHRQRGSCEWGGWEAKESCSVR